MLLSGIAVQLPWLQSCSSTETEDANEPLPPDISPFNALQFKTIRALQRVLFPDDGNGPGAKALNADQYLCWIFRDKYLDEKEKENFISKLNQFISTCKKEQGIDFIELNSEERNEFVKKISDYKWGDKFLSRNLTFIFEALLLDPIYGVNTNKEGWKWLQHNPGNPRPNATNLYPQILKLYEV